MADNKVEFEIELITKAFESALREAAKGVESFGKDFEKVEKDASKSLDTVGKAGKDAGDQVSKGGKEATSAWDVFKGVLGAEVFVSAFSAITGAAKGLFDTFVVDGVKGALEAEAALVKLKSTLAVTGEATDQVVADFQAFAGQLQKNTMADGDAVLAQLALAKQYGLTNEQAKQVVNTAQDMAARGYDAETSVRQLSESFSGQAGRLAKLNPALRELTEEQLKSGAAAELLGEQFAGSAAAKVATYEGSLAQAKNAFGDLQEEIGFLITQNPALIEAIQQAVGLFQTMTGYIAENGDEIKNLISTGLTGLVEGIERVVGAGQAFITFLQENETGLKAVGVGLGVAAVAYGAYTLAINAGAIATGVATAAATTFNFVLSANPIGIVVVALGALAAGIYYAAQNWNYIVETMAVFAGGVLTSIMPAINLVLEGLGALAVIFSEDLAQSIADAQLTVQTAAEELLLYQAEADGAAAAQKQLFRDDQALKDAEANKAKLDGLVATQTKENALAATDNQVKLQTKAQQLVSEANLQKAADETKKKQDKDTKKALEDAEKEQNRKFTEEKREAQALWAREEAAWQKEQDRRKDEEAKRRINRESNMFDALRAESAEQRNYEDKTAKEKLRNFESTLSQISSLQRSSSKELGEIGKAAAITEATMNTYKAANVALASAPPPFNYALAAAVTVAGLENVRRIQAGGFQDGGIVGGSSFTGDNMVANVNSREAIFTMSQQKRLYDMANGSGGGNSSDVVSRLDRLEQAILGQPVVVQIDGETIATAVRTQVKAGFSLGGS